MKINELDFTELVNPDFRKIDLDCPFCKRHIQWAISEDLVSYKEQYKKLEIRYVELRNRFDEIFEAVRSVLEEWNEKINKNNL